MEMLILRTKNGPFGLFWTEMTQKSIMWIGNRTCFAVHTPLWEMEDNSTGRHWIPPRKSGCNAHSEKIDACTLVNYFISELFVRNRQPKTYVLTPNEWALAYTVLVSLPGRLLFQAGDPAAYIHTPGPQVAHITKGREFKRSLRYKWKKALKKNRGFKKNEQPPGVRDTFRTLASNEPVKRHVSGAIHGCLSTASVWHLQPGPRKPAKIKVGK